MRSFSLPGRLMGFGDMAADVGVIMQHRVLLQTLSALASGALDSIAGGDPDAAANTLAALRAYPDGDWTEGRATKNSLGADVQAALDEFNRPDPGIIASWSGTPPKQTQSYIDAGKANAIRVMARSNSNDFTIPAALTTEEAAQVSRLESTWEQKVRDDEARAKADECNPLKILTGEMSTSEYFSKCAPPWVKYAAIGAVGFIGYKIYKAVR